jgi:hypothetical protein
VGVLLIALVRAPSAAYALAGGAALCAGLLAFSRRSEGRPIMWPWLVAAFTFLDGFALPAVLAPAQLTQGAQLRMLMGFGLGAIVIAMLLIALALGAWRLMQAARLVVPRTLLNDICSATLYGLGAFWLLTRLP